MLFWWKMKFLFSKLICVPSTRDRVPGCLCAVTDRNQIRGFGNLSRESLCVSWSECAWVRLGERNAWLTSVINLGVSISSSKINKIQNCKTIFMKPIYLLKYSFFYTREQIRKNWFEEYHFVKNIKFECGWNR